VNEKRAEEEREEDVSDDVHSRDCLGMKPQNIYIQVEYSRYIHNLLVPLMRHKVTKPYINYGFHSSVG
jgi:hypothetical protein